MTAEHHHKQDEPLTARSFKEFLQTVKTPPSRTTWLVLVVALLVVALVGTWFYLSSTATASSSGLWLKLDQAGGDDLEKFAADPGHQGSVQGRFAQAEAARRDLSRPLLADEAGHVLDPGGAVALLGSSTYRGKALEEIDKARAAYEKLVEKSGDTPALMQE